MNFHTAQPGAGAGKQHMMLLLLFLLLLLLLLLQVPLNCWCSQHTVRRFPIKVPYIFIFPQPNQNITFRCHGKCESMLLVMYTTIKPACAPCWTDSDGSFCAK